ncbi:DUF6234 family protein [Streptomyces noursei]|uniref:DUF6234 domain-containing protein n=1 Tax=Streptomyces noursei TaxID=1971 RepID=A0A059VYP6_STRNR|nr:DUF6234 family protein [Streptomyces noursei]AIA00696.1 hypothetical protein DC74_168 [Streptomyces noursei]MCZ0976018.1 DUF6234 family protein [Streptomyces noursei]GCB88299.1 hypothetical protein SALB_00969 [Streptomyces noursei]
MTDAFPAPERRRPWSRRTRLGVDLALAIPLFLLETAWLVVDWIFRYGLELWAAQGEQARIDVASLAHTGRVRVLLISVLIVAVLAAVFRARWTVIAHLLVALLAYGSLTAAQYDWERRHAPPPGCVRYSANC